jgi:hypothetical protein
MPRAACRDGDTQHSVTVTAAKYKRCTAAKSTPGLSHPDSHTRTLPVSLIGRELFESAPNRRAPARR